MASFAALECSGASLSFVGNGSYDISGNTVVLHADKIQNNDFGGISGTIRLELWAFSSPYPGTTFGYKLASYVVGQLNGGYYYYSINSGSIPFSTPPAGTWYFSLQAREYVGSGSDGYVTRDYINFSLPKRVAGGAFFGDEEIVGQTSWQTLGSSVNLQVEKVSSSCNLGTSGSLRLDLWATTSPYGGGTITGYRFGSVPLNPLTGGYEYNNINQNVPFTPPPDGFYYVTLTLSEYHNGSYVTVDYLNYPSLQIFGNPPPGPPTAYAATSTTSGGFIANWSSSARATGYRLDVSASSSFSSYVSGYQNLNVGNVLGFSVSGLNSSTTYYYRVRANNSSGASDNSGTIAVTTSIGIPAAPIANAGTGVTSGGFVANWNGVNGAAGYLLDVSTSSAFGSYVPGYQGLDVGNVLGQNVSGLSGSTTYYYRVRAYNIAGTSGNSSMVAVTTSIGPPGAPTAKPATSVVPNGFAANWGNASGATGYRLDVSSSSSFSSYVGGYQDLDVGNVLSRSVTGLNENAAYYYRVRAYNGVGTSGNSGIITVTTPVPSRIISLSGVMDFGNVNVGGVGQRTLTIGNSGNSTLTVYSVTLPDGFSGTWSGTISAGSATNLPIAFTPVLVTTYSGAIVVNSDATAGNNSVAASGMGAFVPTAAMYNGLFYEAVGITHESSGFFTVKTSAKGSFSAKFLLAGKAYSISGKIGTDGRATNVIARRLMSPLTVELAIDFSGTDRMLGRITDGLWSADLSMDKVFYTKASPAPFSGAYTMRIPGNADSELAPRGDGFGIVTVDAGGKVSFKGTLADGTKITQTTSLSKYGQWPLYIPLYSGQGSVLAWLTFVSSPTNAFSGDMSWTKPSNSSAKYYPAGFELDTAVAGFAYSPPPSGNRILNFSDGTVSLAGGDLSETLVKAITLGLNNKVTGDGVSLTFTTSNGLLKGKVINPATGKPISFQGAVSSAENLGFGFFLGTSQSGQVNITQ